MNRTTLGSTLFFGVALLSVIVALLPLVRGGSMNVVFLSVAVVFFVLGVAIKRRSANRP
jgi:hypothetical protein